MKAIVRIGDLRAAVEKAVLAVERDNTIPILGCLLLACHGDAIDVKGTDLDIVVTATAPTLSGEAGAVCVNARRLAAVLRVLPRDQEAELRVVEGQLTIDVAAGRLAFIAVPAKDWPDLERKGERRSVDVPTALLSGTMRRLMPFISREETRYYLNGICVHRQGDEAVAVATDGRRLGLVPLPIAGGFLGAERIIVPRKTVSIVEQITKRSKSEHVAVRFYGPAAPTSIAFSVDGLRIDSKLIQGTYPDYERVIPRDPATVLEADRARLIAVIDLLAPFFVGDSHRVGRLMVPLVGPASLAAGREEGAIFAAPIRRIAGKREVLAGYNLNYLRLCVQACSGTTIRIEFTDEESPLLMSGGDGAIFIQMPLRVFKTLLTALPEGAAPELAA